MGIFCLFYQTKLAALTSNELPDALAARVEHHLGVCPDCLTEWARQQRMAAALRSAAPDALAPSPFLWERLENALQAETMPRAPVRASRRYLAPLATCALAGIAAAAVYIGRPRTAGHVPNSAQLTHDSHTTDVVKKAPPAISTVASALELARKAEKLVDTPQPKNAQERSRDPFVKRRLRRALDTLAQSEQGLRHVRTARLTLANKPRHSPLPPSANDLPPRAKNSAVALIEVGMHRVVEESQTAELNRLVNEAEKYDQAALGTATDATVNAQHTQGSLFQ
jgi:Putative zinc-finger